jgi:hypothetical protein
VISSKYPGVSHSPRKASSRNIALRVSCSSTDFADLPAEAEASPSSFSLSVKSDKLRLGASIGGPPQ